MASVATALGVIMKVGTALPLAYEIYNKVVAWLKGHKEEVEKESGCDLQSLLAQLLRNQLRLGMNNAMFASGSTEDLGPANPVQDDVYFPQRPFQGRVGNLRNNQQAGGRYAGF